MAPMHALSNLFTSSRLARWGVMLAILVSSIGCDQATKRIAMTELKGTPSRSYLGDVLRLQYAENPGAFLGLGGDLPPAARWVGLVGFNGLLAMGITIALLWTRHMPAWRFVACALLLSGALGNLIDRVRFDGLVIDFLNVGVGPLRTGIFNVADMAISLGAILLVWPLAKTTDEPPVARKPSD
jgi:signal peptidase II